MQEIFGFLGLVIVISASGVMSPGPLFAANVMYGLREGKISGIKMAIGCKSTSSELRFGGF